MSEIRVILFDDSTTIRESLQLLINGAGGLTCVKAFPNALNAITDIEATNPDLVLMDIDMPGITGIDAVKNIRKHFRDLPIIMVTVFDDDDKIFPALRRGANGYLLKNTRPDKIITAIRDVAEGGASFTPSIAKRVLNHFQEIVPQNNSERYALTEREVDVLTHLVKGDSCKQIGNGLGIGYETVRSHLKNIYRKLHVSSMSEAVSKTLRERLLD